MHPILLDLGAPRVTGHGPALTPGFADVPFTVDTAAALAAVGAGAAVLARGYRSGSSGTSKRSR